LATTLVLLVYLKAIMAVDLTWDSLSYHLSFSALRVGLMTHWQFQRGPVEKDNLAAYYKGFPIFADIVRGWLWKLTGRPEATNLFGISVLVALVGYLKWAFRLPASWAFIGLFAIPAVQTAASGSYVDLPASAALAIFIFSVCDLWANRDKFRTPARWIIMFFAAFAAANTKLQTSVFVCLTMPFILPPVWWLLRERNARWQTTFHVGLLLIAGALVVQYNVVRNLLHHGNPFWPVEMRIAGIHFVGPVAQDAWLSPDRPFHWLPQPLQWLVSIIEFHALDGRDVPYSMGMGSTNPLGGGMGGFFSGLVFAAVCFFILAVNKRRDWTGFCFLGTFVYFTIVSALFPNGQILRYDIFWIMFVVLGALILLQSPSLEPYLQSYRIVLFAALAFVTSVTAGASFIPERLPMQEYVDRSGAEQILEKIVKPNDVICLEQGKGHFDNRFTILFAPIFHKKLAAERPYAIKEGYCDGYKTISDWTR
jgi:hypothetical protein